MDATQALGIVARTRRIHGWFATEAALLFAWIDEIQKANGVVGDIFEVGVHHGKSAVLLGAMARNRIERLCVCDLFENQTANISGSGSGDRAIFEANVAGLVAKGLDIRIYVGLSGSLTPQEIGTRYRFFHVDGGHNPDEALSDLRLAAESTLHDGVIAIDDALNPDWPGVSEAVFRFLMGNPDFRAIVGGFNKMVLVRRRHAELYLRELDREDRRHAYGLDYPWHFKVLPFMGDPLRIFFLPSHLKLGGMSGRLRRFYHAHAWVRTPLLRPLVSFAKLLLR